MSDTAHLVIRDLTMSYGQTIIQKDLNFSVARGEVMAIMGGSGCGKSTLLRHLIGLVPPASGEILLNGIDIWNTDEQTRLSLISRSGVLYQGGALWSSLTLLENISLPLQEYSDLSAKEISALASYKLSLVGLTGFEDYYPSEISGGMQKRAGLARAIALDPEILFFDEPSAGLDPVSSKRLDDLIIQLRDSLGATIVIVTHELASIFEIADNSVFLDSDAKTMIASGPPRELLKSSDDPRVLNFLQRSTA